MLLDDESTILMIAREKNLIEPSGCLLLHIDPRITLGVYCVGTIPERRISWCRKIDDDHYARICISK